MGSTRGTHVSMMVQERMRRLESDSPSLRRHITITEANAIKLISPLSTTVVTENDFQYIMKVLEILNSKSEVAANNMAKYISLNITLGLENGIDTNLSKYSISESCKNIINRGLAEADTCQRIIDNQERLSKRFNIDKIVSSNRYNLNKIISELCELIDTYDTSDHIKYNVALENIMYSLAKNGIAIENDSDIATAITEYFMMRDMSIPDNTYSLYQEILKENVVYDLSNKSKLIEAVINKSPGYYRSNTNQVINKSSDDFITSYIYPKTLNINTESSALEYMENVAAYIESGNISEQDEARLYYSIDAMPKYTGISKDFINIKKAELFDQDRFDKLVVSDSILSDLEPINEKEKQDIFNKLNYNFLFGESTDFASTSDIQGLLAKYKSEQEKSPSKIKNFINKLHTKTPESIIDDAPSIMSFIRGGILLGVATLTPIGPIIAGVLGLVSWLISKSINDKEANRLLTTIRNEKKSVNNKIEKTSNTKKKEELENYLACLKECEKKVVSYLDSIEDADHNDPDDDDFDFGDDFDFDEAASIVKIDQLLKLSETMLDQYDSNVNLESVISVAIENNLISDISSMIRTSSITDDDFASALLSIKENSSNTKIRTAITVMQDSLKNENPYCSVKDIYAESIANKTIAEMNNEIIQEKFSLNSIKLALQAGKAKLKDLGTKEKSMWQSVDAIGSGLVRSIEKAMTSDRREAIIKGSIIPSFSKCIKGALALAGIGIIFSPMTALISAIGGLACSQALNAKERKLLFDEIDTELKVVEKQLDIAQNDGDMNQYRFLLNYQKKLTREYQRIKYGLKVQGRDIPKAVIPGK